MRIFPRAGGGSANFPAGRRRAHDLFILRAREARTAKVTSNKRGKERAADLAPIAGVAAPAAQSLINSIANCKLVAADAGNSRS